MRRCAIALLVAAGTALAGTPTASAAEKAIWGPVTLPGGGSAFPTYQDLGVDTFQYTLYWDLIAPERPANSANPADPAYRWPQELDQAVAEAARRGINVALLVSGSPEWANGGRSRLHAPGPDAYADFMATASRRYPTVRRWMVWGEPNKADRFQPNEPDSPIGPRAYAVILDAAFGALKSVSAQNIVIGGMTWTGGEVKPEAFMNFMRLPNGRPPRLDWFGHNPFPFRFPNIRELAIGGGYRDISDTDTFSDQLRQTYGPGAKLWLSEFLVLSDRGSDQFEPFVSREEQARWLAASYKIADDLDSVAGLGWLGLLDEAPRPMSSNWGLMTASAEPKPAFHAYGAASSERFRPAVKLASRVRRKRLARRGLFVRVRPVHEGPVTVVLHRRGRRVARATLGVRGGASKRFRLHVPRARRGRYVATVRARRGSAVRRTLVVR